MWVWDIYYAARLLEGNGTHKWNILSLSNSYSLYLLSRKIKYIFFYKILRDCFKFKRECKTSIRPNLCRNITWFVVKVSYKWRLNGKFKFLQIKVTNNITITIVIRKTFEQTSVIRFDSAIWQLMINCNK